jgi:hypothetical protein
MTIEHSVGHRNSRGSEPADDGITRQMFGLAVRKVIPQTAR